MDPYEKYDMTFNGAAPTRVLSTSPGKYSGQDNGWVLALVEPVIVEFDKTIMKFPNTRRFVGGASNDLVPNLQNPDNPVPLLKQQIDQRGEPHAEAAAADGSYLHENRGGLGRPFIACRCEFS